MLKMIGDDKKPETFREYRDCLFRFYDIFSEDKSDIGFSNKVTHDIELKDDNPVYTQQFRLPEKHLQMIKDNVAAWLKLGIIEKTKSKFNSPIFVVPKKPNAEGIVELRVVLDYRKLNAKSLPDRYSIRTIDECIQEVGKAGSTVFSALDLTSGFWQMDLEKESRKYTAFTIPGVGQFQWCRGAMGLTGCPASFSRLMEVIMEGAQNVLTYIDDVLVHSPTHSSHVTHLTDAFTRIRKAGLKLNPDKCQIGRTQLQYLGITLSGQGIQPGLEKMSEITNLQPPRTQKQLKAFLGLANFFRNFIHKFAKLAAPLFALTRKKTSWADNNPLPPQAMLAFQAIKRAIAAKPILALPDKNKKFHLYVDAAQGDSINEGGFGAALMQFDDQAQRRVIAFASRRLEKHEKNYPACILEMAATMFGMEAFECYLKGRQFCLYSDHKPLENLTKVHNKTFQNLTYRMQTMFPEYRYVPGKENVLADFLSRYEGLEVHKKLTPQQEAVMSSVSLACPTCTVDANPARLKLLQSKDPQIQPLIAQLAGSAFPKKIKGYLYKFSVQPDGLVYVHLPNKTGQKMKIKRILVPELMKKELIAEAHNSKLTGHGGIFRTKQRILQDFWWPNMEKDIATHIQQCIPCQTFKYDATTKAPLKSLPVPTGPNQRIHADLYGPFKTASKKGNKVVLAITDAFHGFCRTYALPDKEAITVGDTLLNQWIYIFGVPKQIHTDQGTEFCNELHQHLWQQLNIKKTTSSVQHPQCNAQVERFNREMKEFIGTALVQAEKSSLDWEDLMGPLQLCHNTAVSKATNTTPFQAQFGYDPRLPLWTKPPRDDERLDVDSDKFADHLSKIRQAQWTAHQLVHQTKHDEKQKQKYYHDRQIKGTHRFKDGDPVYIRRLANNLPNPKICPKYEPGRILKRIDDHTYWVTRVRKGKPSAIQVNIQHLKPRVEEEEIQHSSSEEEEITDNDDQNSESQDTDTEESSEEEDSSEEDDSSDEEHSDSEEEEPVNRRRRGRPRKTEQVQRPPQYDGPLTRSKTKAQNLFSVQVVSAVSNAKEERRILRESIADPRKLIKYLQQGKIIWTFSAPYGYAMGEEYCGAPATSAGAGRSAARSATLGSGMSRQQPGKKSKRRFKVQNMLRRITDAWNQPRSDKDANVPRLTRSSSRASRSAGQSEHKQQETDAETSKTRGVEHRKNSLLRTTKDKVKDLLGSGSKESTQHPLHTPTLKEGYLQHMEMTGSKQEFTEEGYHAYLDKFMPTDQFVLDYVMSSKGERRRWKQRAEVQQGIETRRLQTQLLRNLQEQMRQMQPQTHSNNHN